MAAQTTQADELEAYEPGSGVFRTATPLLAASTLESVPWSLHAHDQMDLRWYCAGGALVAIEESTFARQLERAALMGRSFRPCKRCGGRRWKATTDAEIVEARERAEENVPEAEWCWKPGTGFVPTDGTSYKKALRAYQRRAAKQAGFVIAQGFAEEGLKAMGMAVISHARADELFPELPPLLCKPCPTCEGLGVVDRAMRRSGPITAFPTGSSKRGTEGPAVSLDESALERHGRISRLLKAVRAESLLAPEVLEAYFQPGGSYRAVWVFTEAGQRILDQERKSVAAALKLRPDAIFANVAAQEQRSHDVLRKHDLDAAQREAIELVKEAGRVWNRVVERELLEAAMRGTYGPELRLKVWRAFELSRGRPPRAVSVSLVDEVRLEQARRMRVQRRGAKRRGDR